MQAEGTYRLPLQLHFNNLRDVAVNRCLGLFRPEGRRLLGARGIEPTDSRRVRPL